MRPLVFVLLAACAGDAPAPADTATKDCTEQVDCGDGACTWCRREDGTVVAVCVDDGVTC